ncbi:MAG: RNA polymerase sigma factor [Armatimonadota bacterium]
MARRDDHTLAERAQAGDREAFRELFERHHRRIYNYAAYMLPSAEDAADATQDAFVKAWRGLARLREPEALEGWLWQIARNAVLDAARRRRAGPEEQYGEDAQVALKLAADESDQAAPAAALEQQELGEIVRTAIRSLPAIHREPLVMHYLQGLSIKQIAAALEAPEGTVLSRLARGREALKRKLGTCVSPE